MREEVGDSAKYERRIFPLAAVVDEDMIKAALLLNAADPSKQECTKQNRS